MDWVENSYRRFSRKSSKVLMMAYGKFLYKSHNSCTLHPHSKQHLIIRLITSVCMGNFPTVSVTELLIRFASVDSIKLHPWTHAETAYEYFMKDVRNRSGYLWPLGGWILDALTNRPMGSYQKNIHELHGNQKSHVTTTAPRLVRT